MALDLLIIKRASRLRKSVHSSASDLLYYDVDRSSLPMTTHSNHDREAAARSRCKPLTWPEVQSIISAGDLHKLARSEEQKQDYCKARSKVRLIFLCLLLQRCCYRTAHSTNSSSPCEQNSTHHGQYLLLRIDQK